MKEVTGLMIDMFKIKEIGYDFMGYRFSNSKTLSFHHLIVPKKYGGKIEVDNGAILVRSSSHDYLHLIEKMDRKSFKYITKEMIEENKKRAIDIENLKRIDEILSEFEYKHSDDVFKNGHFVIRDVYTRRLLKERI